LKNWIYRLRRESEEAAGAILPVRVISSRSPAASQRDDGAAVEVMLVRFASGTAGEFIVEIVERLRRC
jgi:hypothetical protein